jgi:hypothetical protein
MGLYKPTQNWGGPPRVYIYIYTCIYTYVYMYCLVYSYFKAKKCMGKKNSALAYPYPN